jgi:pimeloyl-ACP methyl ester carboxylesterase
MQEFSAPTVGGELVGAVTGDGPRLLALHGGPGMSNCLGSLLDELRSGYRIATFQQRGVPPSVESGPYDIATAVADVVAVLDHLDWQTAYLVGHSWGGHLALHVAASRGDRVDGVLCVDPLGAVGDGGEKAMDEEFARRVPADVLARAAELDEQVSADEATADKVALESLRLVWPAYHATWDGGPPFPDDLRLSVATFVATFASIRAELPALEAALPSIGVPVGFLVGGASPIPASVSTDTAARMPAAWVERVDGVGHFPWWERAGCVRAAVDRLVAR